MSSGQRDERMGPSLGLAGEEDSLTRLISPGTPTTTFVAPARSRIDSVFRESSAVGAEEANRADRASSGEVRKQQAERVSWGWGRSGCGGLLPKFPVWTVDFEIGLLTLRSPWAGGDTGWQSG